MSDLISRQAVLDALDFLPEDWRNVVAYKVEKIPPVERKGKWIHDPDPDAGLGWYTCSECGHNDYKDPDFCPNCGADMRGEEDE